MSIKIAINGFGRIGRLILREWLTGKYDGVNIVLINDSSCSSAASHLLKYDSVHGVLPNEVKCTEDSIIVDGKSIRYTSERDASKLPLENVDMVFECTGKYRSKEKCQAHFDAGCKRVLISAPGENVDFTVVYGVNHDGLKEEHKVISNASCTTNCLAPLVKVLQESIGIESGYMSTVHSYTGDQKLVDAGHVDFRRARSAANNIIPTSTGAAKAIGLIFPELVGKLHGVAMRVPVPNVSLVQLTFIANRNTSIHEINDLMMKGSIGELNGILGYNDQPLVSSDFNSTRYSSIFDATQTDVVDGKLCTVTAWYDNEYGFSCRMLDVARHCL
jgi:glyceraldehyde 3-phosphate dehydrogenase